MITDAISLATLAAVRRRPSRCDLHQCCSMSAFSALQLSGYVVDRFELGYTVRFLGGVMLQQRRHCCSGGSLTNLSSIRRFQYGLAVGRFALLQAQRIARALLPTTLREYSSDLDIFCHPIHPRSAGILQTQAYWTDAKASSHDLPILSAGAGSHIGSGAGQASSCDVGRDPHYHHTLPICYLPALTSLHHQPGDKESRAQHRLSSPAEFGQASKRVVVYGKFSQVPLDPHHRSVQVFSTPAIYQLSITSTVLSPVSTPGH
ncbi:hypothetical protein F5X99DRAFT_430987 [Biscogniauxia marginata]|nr:hypothetical protein F5X99DRAFT_430987 [Biscogniauxia marginata]